MRHSTVSALKLRRLRLLTADKLVPAVNWTGVHVRKREEPRNFR